MPSFSFSEEEHAVKVLQGLKETTIRPERKMPIKIGQKAHLFYKLRTKICQRLGIAKVSKITIIKFVEQLDFALIKIENNGRFKTPKFEERENIAVRDGFSNYTEMETWFRKKYKKKGSLYGRNFQLIEWDRFTPEKEALVRFL